MRQFLRPALALVFLLQSLSLFATAEPGQRRSGVYFGTLLSSAGPVAGAVIRDLETGATAVTNAAGRFHLFNVSPEGTSVEVAVGQTLSQVDLQPLSHGRGHGVIAIVSGGLASISVSPRGHSGEEIEGLVQSVDGTGGTLTVADQHLGTVTVTTTDSTEIRHGDTAIPLAQVQVGWRVHVKGALQTDGTYAATEIIVQDEGSGGGGGGGETEAQGTIQSIDSVAMSFTVQESDGTVVTIDTDANTVFTMGGQPASFSDLATGQMVEVEGTTQADGSVLASHVSIEVEETEVQGTVQSIDSVAMSFTIQEQDGTVVTIDTDASTVFRMGDHSAAFTDIVVGDSVEVTGVAQADGSILASRVNIEAPEIEPVEVAGSVSSIDTGAGTFVVTTDSGDVTVATDANTQWHGHGHPSGIGDLAVGDHVQVEGTMQPDASVLASSVDIGD